MGVGRVCVRHSQVRRYRMAMSLPDRSRAPSLRMGGGDEKLTQAVPLLFSPPEPQARAPLGVAFICFFVLASVGALIVSMPGKYGQGRNTSIASSNVRTNRA